MRAWNQGSGRKEKLANKKGLKKHKRTFCLVRDHEALGQEVMPEGVGGRGGREGEDAFLAVAQEEMDGQASALVGRLAEKGRVESGGRSV
jgi:hypothetical protein